MQMATDGTVTKTTLADASDPGTRFDAAQLDALVESFAANLIELQPPEEKPYTYLLWLACQLREFFLGDDLVVQQTLHNVGTNFLRASSFVIETNILHRKLPSEKLCMNSILPGDLGTCERAILHQANALQQWFTPDYRYGFLAFLRQSAADEQWSSDTRVLGSRLRQIGDYKVGDTLNGKHRLYVLGYGMKLTTDGEGNSVYNLTPIP